MGHPIVMDDSTLPPAWLADFTLNLMLPENVGQTLLSPPAKPSLCDLIDALWQKWKQIRAIDMVGPSFATKG